MRQRGPLIRRGAVVCLAVGLGACDTGVTTLRLDVSLAANQTMPQTLVVTLWNHMHILAGDQTISRRDLMLPGHVEALLPDSVNQVRAALIGDGNKPVRGWARVVITPEIENFAPVVLSTSVPDTDGDGVPDPVDNCDSVANHNQLNSNGGMLGDACSSGDGGEAKDL